jgi:hypothetical protein
MNLILDFIKNGVWEEKYGNENFNTLEGEYHPLDGHILYKIVRELKPITVLELAPRKGRTSSCIVNALIKNGIKNVKYFLFEKNAFYFDKIKEYLKDFSGIDFYAGSNIIDSEILDSIRDIDLLLIDANHDYILARWYIQNLFPKLNTNSIIHIHDMHYNRTGKDWTDITFLNGGPNGIYNHPDVIDVNVLKLLYPTIFDKYFTGEMPVQRYEGDEIKEFYEKNSCNLDFWSTCDLAVKLGKYSISEGDPNNACFPASLYFYVKYPNKLVIPNYGGNSNV